MTFKTLSQALASLTAALSLSLLFLPQSVLWVFGVEPTESALFISRRAGALFIAFAVIAYLGRTAAPSSLRQAVCLGLSLSFGALAVLGIFELTRGYAGPGILFPIVAETLFAYAYWLIWRNSRFEAEDQVR